MTYDNLYLIKIFEKIKEFSFSSRSLENSEMNWNYTGTGKTKIVSKITSDKNEFYFFENEINEKLLLNRIFLLNQGENEADIFKRECSIRDKLVVEEYSVFLVSKRIKSYEFLFDNKNQIFILNQIYFFF